MLDRTFVACRVLYAIAACIDEYADLSVSESESIVAENWALSWGLPQR